MSETADPPSGRLTALGPRAAAVVLFIFGLYPLANRFTDGDAAQWYHHALLFWIFIGGSLLVVLFALARWQGARMEELARRFWHGFLNTPPAILITALAVLAFAASALLAIVCFGRQPHNADEVAQLFHARILLSGRFALPADPNPEFFGMDNMIDWNRWYSQFPIGGPAFLTLGVALHCAWLVNPALIGLTVVSVYQFTRRAYDEPSARVSAVLFAVSPFALFMGASFMNHVPTLWLTSVAMWQLAVWTNSSTPRQLATSAGVIGFSLGVAFTIRPLDALAMAGVIGALQLMPAGRAWARVRSLGVQVVAGVLPVCVLLYANAVTNGSPFRLGYEVLYGSAHQLGFHLDPYGTLHTPLRAVVFASKYLLQLNVLLFEWPLPAVGVLILGLVALRRPSRWDVFLVLMLFAQTVVYAFYWHDGRFRGPRFLFTALAAIVILVARAPFVIAPRLRGAGRLVAMYALPACIVMAWTAYGIGDSALGRIRQYRSASPILRIDPDSLVAASGIRHAVVFINEGREARNLHFLWSLGLTRGDAARLMVSASSCAVRVAIDDEEARPPATLDGRRDRMIRRALSIDAAAMMSPSCEADARRDSAGTASYAAFFPANTIGPEGRVDGDVVYLLDLGAHNEVLRSRFGDRAWYRFGPHARASDSLPTLIPYSKPQLR